MTDIVYNTPIKLDDPTSFATTLAKQRAAELNRPATAIINGVSITQYPPSRPTDILDLAQGKPRTPKETEDRTAQANNRAAMVHMNQAIPGDEGGTTRSYGSPVNQFIQTFGPARERSSAIIPGMEAILGNIPQAALGKVLSLLPPTFKSLLPIGSVAGLVANTPVSLNGLTQLVGGAALGAVAGQTIRAVTGGGLNNVSGLSGVIGAQAISKTGYGSSLSSSNGIPLNIARTYVGNNVVSGLAGNLAGNLSAQYLGTSGQSSAIIANVVGTVANVALNNRSGIPLSPQVLGLAANVALRATGVPTVVPTGVLGVATNLALSSVSSLIGNTIGARIPVLPSNLSVLPNLGALSGLTQSLDINTVQSAIPGRDLQTLLPGNIQNQVPDIPARVTNPASGGAAQNDILTRRQTNPEQMPQKDLQPRQPPPDAVASPLGEVPPNGPVPYGAKISKFFTLGQLSAHAYYRYDIVPTRGLSMNQIAQGLAFIASNILDPIVDHHPSYLVTCGFRGRGSTNYPNSDHCIGGAVDIQWTNRRGDKRYHLDICREVRQLNLPASQVIFEAPGSVWCHVAGGPNPPNQTKRDNTWFGGGYLSGFISN